MGHQQQTIHRARLAARSRETTILAKFRTAGATCFAVSLLAACGGRATNSPSPQPLVLANVRLIEGCGAEPIPDAAVVIEGRRIAASGPATRIQVPDLAHVIDGEGAVALPGLFDAHVHLASALREGTDAVGAWLVAGVTTIVDMGTPHDPSRWREELAARFPRGPRLLIAGPIVTAPGGYPFVGRRSSALEIDRPQEVESALAHLLDPPMVDHLKISFDRGFASDLHDDGWPVLKPATVERIVALANRRKLRVSAHVTQPGELAAIIEMGVDNAAHAPAEPIPDRTLAAAAAADFVLVSTASLWRETPERLRAVQYNLRRYLDLGGRVALGTDAPAFHDPGLPLLEMKLLESGGLTPTEILCAATGHAAFAVGRSDDLGRLAPGYLADLVLVEGDPLRRLEDLENVSLVVRDGRVVSSERADR